MRIQKIKIEKFKSIYSPLELNFEETKGFWKISGSVGSGKTTIGEAIMYGLFGTINGKNNADLISWGYKKGTIEIWCISKGKSIYIKREINLHGQSPIYVEIEGEELTFTNKRDAQMQLETEYYDVSRTTLELLCIISFNNFKSLATLNTSDTKKFLDQVLGFSILTDYANECKLCKSSNSTKLSTVSSQIDKIESQIRKIEELSNMEVIEGDIAKVKEDLRVLTSQLDELNKAYSEDISALNEEKSSLVKKQASVLALGKNKKKEIDFIEKGTCPTCGAPIDQSQLEIKTQEKDLLLEQYNSIGREISEVSERITIRHNKLTDDASPIKLNKDKLKVLLVRLEEQAKRKKVNSAEIDSLKQEIEKLEKEYVILQANDAEWSRLYDILNMGIREKVLESFVPSLNQNILTYTQQLHLPYLVQFDESFKCQISLCGMDKVVPISSLSTGQLKTVDMVIILGVLGTVIGKNGINILFLDELFSNLDAGLRNEMCSVLKEFIKENSTIFIISHTELEDRWFDGVINMKLLTKDQYEKHSECSIKKFKENQ